MRSGPPQPLARRTVEGVSLLQQRLINELLRDLNVSEAARRIGIAPRKAYQMLEYPAVSAALTEAYRERTARVQVDADEVLRRVALFFRADRRELAHVRRVNCRYCWGIDHRYQFTLNELREAITNHKLSLRNSGVPEDQWPEFDDLGGDGFHVWGQPFGQGYGQDHDCPECDGLGVEKVWIAPADTYSPSAVAVYGGVKFNARTGEVSILTRDRPEAEVLMMRHLGLLNDREPIQTLDAALLEPDQIETAIVTMHQRLARDDPDALRALAPPEVLEGVEEK